VGHAAPQAWQLAESHPRFLQPSAQHSHPEGHCAWQAPHVQLSPHRVSPGQVVPGGEQSAIAPGAHQRGFAHASHEQSLRQVFVPAQAALSSFRHGADSPGRQCHGPPAHSSHAQLFRQVRVPPVHPG